MRSGEQQQVAGKLANAQRAEEEKQAALRTGEFFKNSANRAETDRPRAVLKQPGGKPPIVFYEW